MRVDEFFFAKLLTEMSFKMFLKKYFVMNLIMVLIFTFEVRGLLLRLYFYFLY